MDRVVIIDTETTGLSPRKGKHRIVNLAAVEIIDGDITGSIFHYFLNPEGKKSTSEAHAVHQIEDSFLLDKPTFCQIAEEFLEFIDGARLSFYNSEFDVDFLQSEIDRCGLDIVFNRDYDVSCLMRDFANRENYGKWVKLDNACIRYGIDISERKSHGAAIDAFITAELYLKFHYSSDKPLAKTPHQNERVEPTAFPIPRAYKDPITGKAIQLNYCKNPNCRNYGVAALNPKRKADGSIMRGLGNDYRFTKTKIGRVLTCIICGTSTKLINNKAFVEESNRQKQIFSNKEICCPDKKLETSRRRTRPCRNAVVNWLDKPKRYTLRGTVPSTVESLKYREAQRIECNACHNPFNVPLNAEYGQKRADINGILFRMLINKGIVNRMEEILDVPITLIYHRIEFFFNQCVEFDRWHIQNNIQALKGKTLEVSMDRQHYLSNWSDKKDSRPTKLVNTSTVDNKTRFVFASTVNFDTTSDWEVIKRDISRCSDLKKPEHKRRYGQYVLSNQEVKTDDVDDTLPLKAPNKNLLVQQTYSLMAHLEVMKQYVNEARYTRLFADADEGFELGIGLVMKEQIAASKLYPVLVKAERNNASQMQDKRAWSEQVLLKHGITMSDIKRAKVDREKLAQISQQYWAAEMHKRTIESGSAKSEWLVHPFPKSRHSVQVKPLVGFHGAISVSQTLSENLLDVSTYGVDNYFQMIRRRINMFERPITSATNSKRWNGYASYNPKWAVMIIEILRVYNNYVLTDEKSLKNKGLYQEATTPAQKLGITDKKYTIEDILDFTVASKIKNLQ
jgi:DNA polymerase III epsilon subunit